MNITSLLINQSIKINLSFIFFYNSYNFQRVILEFESPPSPHSISEAKGGREEEDGEGRRGEEGEENDEME